MSPSGDNPPERDTVGAMDPPSIDATAPYPMQPGGCARCGGEHVGCTAHSRSGKPCGNPPMHGQSVCRMHGGSAPSARAAAEKRLRAEVAERAVVTFGLPREISPAEALIEELHRTAGAVAWLAVIVGELSTLPGRRETEEGYDGTRVVDHGAVMQYQRGEGGILWERPSVWLDLYERERKHLAAVAKECMALGLEQRRVELAEQQGELLARVLRGVLVELNVWGNPETPGVVRRHLELVASTGGAA